MGSRLSMKLSQVTSGSFFIVYSLLVLSNLFFSILRANLSPLINGEVLAPFLYSEQMFRRLETAKF